MRRPPRSGSDPSTGSPTAAPSPSAVRRERSRASRTSAVATPSTTPASSASPRVRPSPGVEGRSGTGIGRMTRRETGAMPGAPDCSSWSTAGGRTWAIASAIPTACSADGAWTAMSMSTESAALVGVMRVVSPETGLVETLARDHLGEDLRARGQLEVGRDALLGQQAALVGGLGGGRHRVGGTRRGVHRQRRGVGRWAQGVEGAARGEREEDDGHHRHPAFAQGPRHVREAHRRSPSGRRDAE